MKKIIIWLLVVIAAAIVGFYALNTYIYNEKQGADEKALTHKDARFVVGGRLVKLSNGVSIVEATPGSASKIETRYFGNELSKDLDGDGTEDVAFIVTQSTGESGAFYYLVGALLKNGAYEGTQAVFLGDRIAPQTTESGKGRIVVVNYADRKPGEAMAVSPSVGKSIWLLLDPESMSFGEVAQNFEGEADPGRMSLGMKEWTWVSAIYGGDALLAPRDKEAFAITFGDDGRFSATTDCNSMGGRYAAAGESLVFSDMFSTKKFCEGSQEAEFSKMLSDVKGFSFTSKGELIFDLNVSGKAIFR